MLAALIAIALCQAPARGDGEALLERSKALRDSQDIHARFDLAHELLQAKQYDEALVHDLWLWAATSTAPKYSTLRVSSLVRDLAELARKNEPAKNAVEAIFNELQTKVDEAAIPTLGDWREWKAFCGYFDARARVITWYEKRRDAQGRVLADQSDPSADLITDDVFDALLQRGRAVDAARLYGDARPRIERIVSEYRGATATAERVRADASDDVLRSARQRFIEKMAKLHGAMLAAQRRDEAMAVADLLLKTLDTPESRLGLVRNGIELVKKPEPSFKRWLDEAEKAGADVELLRRKLARLERGAADK